MLQIDDFTLKIEIAILLLNLQYFNKKCWVQKFSIGQAENALAFGAANYMEGFSNSPPKIHSHISGATQWLFQKTCPSDVASTEYNYQAGMHLIFVSTRIHH